MTEREHFLTCCRKLFEIAQNMVQILDDIVIEISYVTSRQSKDKKATLVQKIQRSIFVEMFIYLGQTCCRISK